MDLTKQRDYLNPDDVKAPIHIIGCGAIGSTLACLLTQMGFEKIRLYDFDKVEAHNLANQMFLEKHVGMEKTEALAELMCAKNTNAQPKLFKKGYINQTLDGYIFLCVDSIELRKKICVAQQMNPRIKAVFDFRMGLTDAQHFAANWSDKAQIQNLINSMDFTDEEANKNSQVTACGTSLSVAYTVHLIVNLGVTNFVNTILKGETKNAIAVFTQTPAIIIY